MARSAKKRHQKKKNGSKSHQPMMDKLQKNSDFQNHEMVERPEGMVKLSDAISEIIKPFEEFADSFEARKKLVTMACLAWNIELSPRPSRIWDINRALKNLSKMSPQDEQGFKAIINELINRKELLYPNDERLIADYELTESKKDFHLQIAYVMRPEEREKTDK